MGLFESVRRPAKAVLALVLPLPLPPPPKKRNNDSSQNPTLQTHSSPKHPGTNTKEDPHHQSRANVRLIMLIKPSFHRATKSNTTHLSRTG